MTTFLSDLLSFLLTPRKVALAALAAAVWFGLRALVAAAGLPC